MVSDALPARPPTGQCLSCWQNDHIAELGITESILITASWRLALAFNTTLPGWLVLLPRTHLTGLDAISDEASSELGPLLRAATGVLIEVVGCERTYVMQFSEAAGFEHLHFHIVPRMADLPEAHRGQHIFHYLQSGKGIPTPTQEDIQLATALRHRLGQWPASMADEA